METTKGKKTLTAGQASLCLSSCFFAFFSSRFLSRFLCRNAPIIMATPDSIDAKAITSLSVYARKAPTKINNMQIIKPKIMPRKSWRTFPYTRVFSKSCRCIDWFSAITSILSAASGRILLYPFSISGGGSGPEKLEICSTPTTLCKDVGDISKGFGVGPTATGAGLSFPFLDIVPLGRHQRHIGDHPQPQSSQLLERPHLPLEGLCSLYSLRVTLMSLWGSLSKTTEQYRLKNYAIPSLSLVIIYHVEIWLRGKELNRLRIMSSELNVGGT